MTAKELSLHLKTPTSVLANWRYKGSGPKFVKVGNGVRYRTSDVESWLDDQSRMQTGQALASA